MIAANPLIDAGYIAGALISIIVLMGLVARSRPVRFIFRRLVGEPVGTWAQHLVRSELVDVGTRITAIEYELRPNNGKSLRDRVDLIASKLEQ